MSNERVKTIKERKVEEKITVRMTDTYLFDFTLYHTYSKLAGFLTNILGAADRVVKLRDGMIRKNYCNEHKLSASELEW